MKQTFNYKQFAADILEQRVKKDLSFKALEDVTGVKSTTLYRLEAAKHSADVETVATVCAWLKKPITRYLKTACVILMLSAAFASCTKQPLQDLSAPASKRANISGALTGAVTAITVNMPVFVDSVAVTLTDLTTGAEYTANAAGVLYVPKNDSYRVWLSATSRQAVEASYSVDISGLDMLGITVQPYSFMKAGNGQTDFQNKGAYLSIIQL